MEDVWRRMGFKPWAEHSTADQEKILKDPDNAACEYYEYWWKCNHDGIALPIDPRTDLSAGSEF